MLKKFVYRIRIASITTLTAILATGIFCSRSNAINPVPVSGRILKASKELGDNSDWMEIARYNDYSLIVRLNCLPGQVPYDGSGQYRGYLNSNVKYLIDRWFLSLSTSSALQHLAVGNTAAINLGKFQDCDTYKHDSPAEVLGNGFSLPDESQPASAFALSFQEARSFLFDQMDLRRTEPAAYANYRYLSEYRKEETFIFGIFSKGFRLLPIESSWLRSPGENIASASCSGDLSTSGRTLYSINVKEPCAVRPAVWVRSSIFGSATHPAEATVRLLDTFIDDEEFKIKLENLLICEERYRLFNSSNPRSCSCTRPKYHILCTGNPDRGIIQRLVCIYRNANIIAKDAFVELGESDISKLSMDDFERFMKSTVENAEGGTLYVNAQKIFDFSATDTLQLRFKRFIETLAAGKCLIIVTNCPPQLKQYIDNDPWHCNMFETLDSKKFLKEKVESSATSHRPTIDECLSPLNSLVGMDNFKELVKSLLHDFRVYEIDSKMGIVRDKPGLHMVLMGNPGTGKTTVAHMLGDILFRAGVIKRNVVVKAERADLVGKYQGHTEAFVRDKLKEAEGGILFLDEAYSLTAGGTRDFGQRAIEGLLTPLTTNQCVIIAAGYTKEMQTFLKSNSGLSGRFSHEVILKDYTSEELVQVIENLCKKSNLILEDKAKKCLFEIFENTPRNSAFSNARYAHKVYDTIMRIRSMSLPVDIDIDSLTESEILQRRTITCEYVLEAKKELEKSL